MNKLEPRIRFEGFDDEWEEQFLGDLTNFFRGQTYKPSDKSSSKNSTLVIRSSNIQNNRIINADNVYIRNDIVDSKNIECGDILVVVRNGSVRLIGKHAIVKKDYKNTVIGAFMTGLKSEFNKYLCALLDTEKFDKEINKNLGATINQITTSNFKKMKFNVSVNHNEKEKIGGFFGKLDDLIENQESYLDLNKKLKKSLLQKLFPKEGEDRPELRFPEFKDKWNLEILKKISNIMKGRQLKKDDVVEFGKYYHLNGGTTPSNRTNLRNTEKNTVTISEGGNSCGYVIFNKEKFFSGGHNYSLKIKSNIDVYFLYSILKSYQDKIMRLRVGSGLPNIQKGDIENFKIKLPSLEEQEKIGSLFKSLDEKIEAEEKKLKAYKDFKKSMLQKMFV